MPAPDLAMYTNDTYAQNIPAKRNIKILKYYLINKTRVQKMEGSITRSFVVKNVFVPRALLQGTCRVASSTIR